MDTADLLSPSQPQPQKTAGLAPNRTKSHQIAPKKNLCMAKKSQFGAFRTLSKPWCRYPNEQWFFPDVP
jgi:hypothetical protein